MAKKVAEGRGSVFAGGTVYHEGDAIPDDVVKEAGIGEHVFTAPDEDASGFSAARYPAELADGDDADGKSRRGQRKS